MVTRRFLLQGIALLLFTVLFSDANSQLPVYSNSFDTLPASYSRIKGVKGNAINFTANAAYRKPIIQQNALKDYTGNFSVSLWAKAAKNTTQEYVLLASKDSADNNTSHNWQIGMQANGAWYCKIRDADARYDYSPTASRQSIRDDKWHQLAFTYDTIKKEIAFYFDGLNTAIFHTPEINKLMADQLFTGGIPEGYLGEWETFNGRMDEVKIFTTALPAIYFFQDYNRHSSMPSKPMKPVAIASFAVMNYNIFHGGHETGKEIGVQRITEVIKASGADIISMQETYGSGAAIADALGYYFYLRSTNLAIFSRFPIETTLAGGRPFNNGGALLQLPGGRKIAFFTNWLNYPVDYWDLFENGKPIDSTTWYRQQDEVNTKSLRNTLQSIAASIDNAKNIPMIFCGDLNTGSHLDWTPATRHLNNGYVMPFPTTKLMEQRGFIDTYRAIHPDPLKDRGITWSPMVPTAFKDRIDYIFYKSGKIKPIASTVINTHPVRYPSDHAAVLTRFVWVK